MSQRRRAVLTGAAIGSAAAVLGSVLTAAPASAHGAMMMPGSRTYLCWKDGLTSTGEIKPKNPACAAAVAQSGTTPLYNWFAVLRSDGAGRTRGFIPDGKLCSADARVYDFSGFDLPRNDWPVTHLTSGAQIQVRYNKWAAHPGTFRLYITKDSWSPTRPLTWDDLEEQPFDQVTDPPSVGNPGNANSYYYWNTRLPSGKSGRHIIYSVWQRSDSQETFYNCSDVVFDGGNGEVTGIG
ncbi:MAG: lytic polysaccharide monooxygenase [Actinomadura rubrobrunea]|nr:lytic polysaccharide monooxygenase [Actinomadura rubrobrunea]